MTMPHTDGDPSAARDDLTSDLDADAVIAWPDAEADADVCRLLTEYRSRCRSAPDDAEGWVVRIADLEGLTDEALAAAHGTAIAADVLEIRMADPQTGLRYRARAA